MYDGPSHPLSIHITCDGSNVLERRGSKAGEYLCGSQHPS